MGIDETGHQEMVGQVDRNNLGEVPGDRFRGIDPLKDAIAHDDGFSGARAIRQKNLSWAQHEVAGGR